MVASLHSYDNVVHHHLKVILNHYKVWVALKSGKVLIKNGDTMGVSLWHGKTILWWSIPFYQSIMMVHHFLVVPYAFQVLNNFLDKKHNFLVVHIAL